MLHHLEWFCRHLYYVEGTFWQKFTCDYQVTNIGLHLPILSYHPHFREMRLYSLIVFVMACSTGSLSMLEAP